MFEIQITLTIKNTMTKIWNKTWISLDSMVEKYTVWNDYILDQKLVAYDVKWSSAHVLMLFKIWIITANEKDILLEWLEKVLQLYNNWDFSIDLSQEDCHTAIESFLIENYWEVWKKIHTWRSRNDQILVTMRLFTLDKVSEIIEKITLLTYSLDKTIIKIGKTKMPWYTHMQRAMPTTVGTWLGSFRDSLADDLIFINAALKVNNQNPLWSVAWFWENIFNLDREFTTKELGFNKVQNNSMYCAYSRWKFEHMILQSLWQVMLDLWKLASDLVLFSSKEFDFFSLPNDFKTGSSVMPQKKNWDIMELIRWNSNLFIWYEQQVRDVFKNLLSWYNRDFQLTKEPYLKWIELVYDTVVIFDLVVQNLWVKELNLENACTEELYATDEAYKLVKSWMSFREAYKIVGDKYAS